MDSALRDAILATIAYHDVLGLAPTAAEVRRYLIAPARFGAAPAHAPAPALVEVYAALDALSNEGALHCVNGFWCIAGRENILPERIERHKLAEVKWKLLRRWGRIFAYLPFVRLVLVSGSLAFHNAHPNSDFDVFIVAKYGRIWMVRFLSSVVLGLLGVRRHKGKVSDRICLNHFITDQSLRIPHPSLYNAQTYARLFPLLELGVTHRAFVAANAWLGGYLVHVSAPTLSSPKQLREPFGARPVRGALEWFLGDRIGDTLERVLRAVQGRRIAADPRSAEPGGRVIATDDELEFHPASPEVVVLKAYRRRLEAMGFARLSRRDESSLAPPQKMP